MKIFQKTLALILCVVMIGCVFTGCESEAEKIEKLAGPWYTTQPDDADEAVALLQNLDFYEEEIALAENCVLNSVEVVCFNADKTYSFYYDGEGTKEATRKYLEDVFAAMYEGRASLSEVYGEDFAAMDETAFQAYYASIYEVENFQALLDAMLDNSYDFEALEEPWETGTYTIQGDRIYCTISGESEAEYLEYSISGGDLHLVYKDGSKDYTR